MTAKTLLLTLTAAALIAAPTAMAQHGPGDCDGTGPHGAGTMGGPGGPGGLGGPGGHGLLRMLPRIAEKIGLSEAQLDTIHAIIDANRSDLESLHDQAAANREAFRDTYDLGDYDEDAFRAHFEGQAAIHIEMQLIGAQVMADVWAVLTPEQQEELLELIELFKPGEGHGGKRHGGGRRYGSGN